MHARYSNGEIIQTAKLDGKTGVVGTVVGKEVNRSLEVEKMINVVHAALNENEEAEQSHSGNGNGGPDEHNKNDEPGVGATAVA